MLLSGLAAQELSELKVQQAQDRSTSQALEKINERLERSEKNAAKQQAEMLAQLEELKNGKVGLSSEDHVRGVGAEVDKLKRENAELKKQAAGSGAGVAGIDEATVKLIERRLGIIEEMLSKVHAVQSPGEEKSDKLIEVLSKLDILQERSNEGQQTLYDELLSWIKPWCESTAKQQAALKEQIDELATKVADPTESEAMKKMLEGMVAKLGETKDSLISSPSRTGPRGPLAIVLLGLGPFI